ncbi:hypothetical protein QUF64_10045 [Anaerolineales bacterium HSG6]|nr:hypothetical protein [Anaerolineales bacterium HSG6]
MDNLIWLSGVIFVVMMVVFLVIRVFTTRINRVWEKHRAETVGKWEAEDIEYILEPMGGQFGGLESMGKKKVIRGVGFVALTNKDLRVTRSTPSEQWIVNFRQMKKITIRHYFLGKRSDKVPFVVIRFAKNGKKDRLGFLVKNYEAWIEALEEETGLTAKDERVTLGK